MTAIQIELQNELRDRLSKYGIEAFELETKELKTYQKLFRAIDKLTLQRAKWSKEGKSLEFSFANVARVAGLSKATIDHNEDIKRIVRSFRPLKEQESNLVTRDQYDAIKEELSIYKRKHEENRKTELDLYAVSKLLEDRDREIKLLQENQESLYNKIAAIKNKDSNFKDMMDRYFPTMPHPTQS